MSIPSYWKGLDWHNGWNDHKPTRVATSQQTEFGSRQVSNANPALEIVTQTESQLVAALKEFNTATLPEDSYQYRQIERYLKANAAARTLRPPQGERTRMERARDAIGELRKKGALGAAETSQMKTQLLTLLEDPSYVTKELRPLYAQHGIKIEKHKPPKSGKVQITGIRVIWNDLLWLDFELARERIARDMQTGDKPALTTGGKVWGRSGVDFTTSSDTGLTEGSNDHLPVLDREIGEVLLMHGTRPDVIKIISGEGFDPTRSKGRPDSHGVNQYGALGQGTYFGDSFAKVQTYAGCPLCGALKCDCVDGDGHPMPRLLILARCLVGVPTKARTHGSHRADSVDTLKAHKHAVIAQERGIWKSWTLFGSNEFLIKSRDQMYPEFVVSWIRA